MSILDNPTEVYLRNLYRKFGTRNPYGGYNTLKCSVCGETRGAHKSQDVSCRCPRDFLRKKEDEYDDDDPYKLPVTRCYSSLDYEDQPISDSNGNMVLITVRKVKKESK